MQNQLDGLDDGRYSLDFVPEYISAVETAQKRLHDLYMISEQLGDRTGLELLEEFQTRKWYRPVIFIIRHKNQAIETRALEMGAVDFLRKDRLNPHVLAHSLDLAGERFKNIQALKNSRQQNQILSAKLIRAQERERQDFARELHDGIGSGLATIKYGLEKILLDLQYDLPGNTRIIRNLIAVIQNTIEESRELHTKLRPPMLDELGLKTTIQWMCRRFKSIHTHMQVETHIRFQEDQVPEPLNIVIYRVIQEALNNIGRHSRAKKATVSLKNEDRSIHLTIHDNGEGFELDTQCVGEMCEHGMGLDNMKERVELSGGRFKIESILHKGTTIQAKWKSRYEKNNHSRRQRHSQGRIKSASDDQPGIQNRG